MNENLLLSRAFDDDLSPEEQAEFEAQLSQSPELQAEWAEMSQCRDLYRDYIEEEVKNADFSQFYDKIAAQLPQVRKKESRLVALVKSYWSHHWLPMLFSSAATAAVGLMIFHTAQVTPTPNAAASMEIASAHSPRNEAEFSKESPKLAPAFEMAKMEEPEYEAEPMFAAASEAPAFEAERQLAMMESPKMARKAASAKRAAPMKAEPKAAAAEAAYGALAAAMPSQPVENDVFVDAVQNSGPNVVLISQPLENSPTIVWLLEDEDEAEDDSDADADGKEPI